ncbi:MAG: hypothetical protein JWO09_3599 [Bacteroidetes bacterium]|nr:hypothetical protein [Bacteroidota bacterium]
MIQKAMLMKVSFVFEIARKDKKFAHDLEENPLKTLQESGIDLSANETIAIIDIVNGTSVSTIAPKILDLRKGWDAVKIEHNVKGRKK